MRWHSILSEYPIITFKNFFYSRKNSLRKRRQQFSLLTLIPLLFTKKVLVTPYHEIAADTMTFWTSAQPSKFTSGISDFFSLPHTRSFCRLTRISRVKSFSSSQTVFLDHTDVTFESFSKEVRAVFSFVSSPFTHLWYCQALELFKVSFFTILLIDDRLIPVCSAIFLVLNAYGAALPVSKPTPLSNPCFLPQRQFQACLLSSCFYLSYQFF